MCPTLLLAKGRQEQRKGKAIEHYEKLLELWKDAEPGIPELEDARKMGAGLKTQFLREIMAWKIRE